MTFTWGQAAEGCEECREAVEVRQAAAPPAAPQPLYLLVGIAPLVTHGVARAPHVSRSSVVVGWPHHPPERAVAFRGWGR